MNKKIFIHIGTHKTGTTSIQNFLAMNRNSLVKTDGIYFPKSGTLCKNTGHHNIAWELLNEKRFNKELGTLNDLLKELIEKDFKSAILSSEDFEYLIEYPEKLKEFDLALCSAGFKTQYLAFFREPEGYAKSLFFELKKRGLESNWLEFLGKVKEKGCISYQNGWHFEFDRTRFISKWNTAIDGSKITSVDFDNAKNNQGVLEAFLGAVGASQQTIYKSRYAKRLNKTSKRKTLYFHISNAIKNLTSKSPPIDK